jgi:hypothetical protein
MVGSIAAACRPVPAARTSLLVETNSLFVITGNLPLPLWKGVGILALIRQESLISEEFPVFSQHIRDLALETSSLQTACTAM